MSLLTKLIAYRNGKNYNIPNSEQHDIFYCYCNCRGETFRREFSQLGELRSLVSEGVNVMALTATATRQTRKSIFSTLHMLKPQIVYLRPIKDKIFFSVAIKLSIEQVFSPIVHRLLEERMTIDRIIIFCRKYSKVSSIYSYFKRSLCESFTEELLICLAID